MALRLLIESNLALQLREPVIECRMRINPRDYIKEFCMVKMSSSRRAGHTSSMLSLGQEMFMNPLFICSGNRMIEYLREILFTDFNIGKETAKNMVVRPEDLRALIHSIGRGGLKRRVDYDAIFVDNYSILTEEEENLVFDYAQNYLKDRFCLVFVG